MNKILGKKSGESLVYRGSPKTADLVTSALSKLPKNFQNFVLRNSGGISESIYTTRCEVDSRLRPHVLFEGYYKANNEEDVLYAASILAHEAQHGADFINMFKNWKDKEITDFFYNVEKKESKWENIKILERRAVKRQIQAWDALDPHSKHVREWLVSLLPNPNWNETKIEERM